MSRRNPYGPYSPYGPMTPVPPAPRVEEFRLGDEERFLFDLWAHEHTRVGGTRIDFWAFDKIKSKRDALYDEAVVRAFEGPFQLIGHITWPDSVPENREEGLRTTFTGSIWIARKELEDANAPMPSEGDVIQVWNIPLFSKDLAVDGEDVPGSGFFFDIGDVDENTHLFSTPYLVGFTCEIARRTEFTPERRLTNR